AGGVALVERKEELLAQRRTEVAMQPVLEAVRRGLRRRRLGQELAQDAIARGRIEPAQVVLDRERHGPAAGREPHRGPPRVAREAGVARELVQRPRARPEQPVTARRLEPEATG